MSVRTQLLRLNLGCADHLLIFCLKSRSFSMYQRIILCSGFMLKILRMKNKKRISIKRLKRLITRLKNCWRRKRSFSKCKGNWINDFETTGVKTLVVFFMSMDSEGAWPCLPVHRFIVSEIKIEDVRNGNGRSISNPTGGKKNLVVTIKWT